MSGLNTISDFSSLFNYSTYTALVPLRIRKTNRHLSSSPSFRRCIINRRTYVHTNERNENNVSMEMLVEKEEKKEKKKQQSFETISRQTKKKRNENERPTRSFSPVFRLTFLFLPSLLDKQQKKNHQHPPLTRLKDIPFFFKKRQKCIFENSSSSSFFPLNNHTQQSI